MKIKMRYEKEFMAFEFDMMEVKGWLNIDLQPDESEEEFEKRAQEEVDKKYNRPEYNDMHRQERHRGYVFSTRDEDGEETGEFEPSMSEVMDPSIFLKDEMERRREESYEAVKMFVYSVLKPDVADIFMSVRIDGMSINEKVESMLNRDDFDRDDAYQKAIAKKANAITQKLKRANKNLKENFSKASDFGICCGYQVGGQNSSNKNKEVK